MQGTLSPQLPRSPTHDPRSIRPHDRQRLAPEQDGCDGTDCCADLSLLVTQGIAHHKKNVAVNVGLGAVARSLPDQRADLFP
ncbi:hypothetical protein EV384_4963 [Micromonospora kangleipakensis]|uniref:Uncharacterized protein n=1 Tax=Micromonospora kangleipakensis TaxID=1077942 RepID=A0A4Q8BG95_9ACTN|nr:hypothetical protein EV384_4963 [Micromonospora kangleipakensis]